MLADILSKDHKIFDNGSAISNLVACRQEGYRPLTLQETYDSFKRHKEEQGTLEFKEWCTGSVAVTSYFRSVLKQLCIYDSDRAANVSTLIDLKEGKIGIYWNGNLLRSKRFFNERHLNMESNIHSLPYEPENITMPVRVAHHSPALKAILRLTDKQVAMLPDEMDGVSLNLHDPHISEVPSDRSICRPLLIHNYELDHGFEWLSIRAAPWNTHAPVVGCRK